MNDEASAISERNNSHRSAEPEFVEIQTFVSRPHFTLRRTAARFCEFEPHSHATFQVTAVLSGRMEASVGDVEFELQAGEVGFTAAGQSHSARAFDVEFISIGISPALVGELVAEIGLARATPEIAFRHPSARDDTIIQTALNIRGELEEKMLGLGAMLDAIVRQLAIYLLRSHLTVRKSAQIEMSRAGPVDRRLRRAIEFMSNNYSRELALEEIASAAFLSEYHFARLFKQITGMTVHVYLANIRLEHARKMLAETELAISEVALRVGYQSQSHFTKIFKSVTGVTPRAYRAGVRA